MGVSLPTSQAWNRRSPCCSSPGWKAGLQGRGTCVQLWVWLASLPLHTSLASAPALGPCAQPAWWRINTRLALHTD